ncbi:MAG: OmpH family outer membrane protein [Myxococcaceae bacterium]|nr:OmpH family outer membrane protein [Myxococcaceae bacterium]
MRRLLPVVLAVSLFSPLARAAELKLGYVDLQRALVEIGEGRLAREKLKGDLDKRKAEFEAEQNKIRDDKAILDKQGAMMSEEVRNQKFTELQKRFYELTQKAEKLQVEMAQAEQKELRKIFDKIDPIIAAIAQREGLTMVFEKSDSGLVYAPPSLDLTNELVRTYNDKYRVAGGKKDGAAPKDAPAAKDAPGAGTK